MPHKGILFVVSGPSGAGKSTVLEKVMGSTGNLTFSVSATTRAPRPGEEDGREYFFLTPERFHEMVGDNAFLEWAQVHRHGYGTPADFVKAQLDEGIDVILDIDVQGARMVRPRAPKAVYIFLAPPSMEELERRLRGRRTESEDRIRVRLDAARSELDAIPEYDYLVVNEHVGTAALQVQSIIEAHRARTSRVLAHWPALDPGVRLEMTPDSAEPRPQPA